MILRESEYVRLEWEPDHSIISYVYTENATPSMTDEAFKENMLAYAEACEQHHPKCLIIDLRLMTFTLTPELQEWTAAVIAPRTTSLQRMAILVGHDLFAQVSVEQLMDEKGIADRYSAPRYFEDRDAAVTWLTA